VAEQMKAEVRWGAPLTDGVSGGAGGAGSKRWHEKEISATME
jgi:hypothetical protein